MRCVLSEQSSIRRQIQDDDGDDVDDNKTVRDVKVQQVILKTMIVAVIITGIHTALTTGATRLARGTQKLLTPEIHLLNVTSLLFDLESNPLPSTFTFRSLGTESAINSTGQLVAPNVFSVICSKTAMTSRHACVINVTTVMEAGEGVYVLDIGNDAGQGHLKFSVSRGTGSE